MCMTQGGVELPLGDEFPDSRLTDPLLEHVRKQAELGRARTAAAAAGAGTAVEQMGGRALNLTHHLGAQRVCRPAAVRRRPAMPPDEAAGAHWPCRPRAIEITARTPEARARFLMSVNHRGRL